MFGSNDDKKTPAEPGEKKGLFGWLRKKPQPASAEQPATEPQADSEPVEQTVANVETPAATPQHEEPRAVEADLQPTEAGLPLEIYCFTADTRWAVYEGVQSDI